MFTGWLWLCSKLPVDFHCCCWSKRDPDKLIVHHLVNTLSEREIWFEKHNESSIIWRDFVMDSDDSGQSSDLPWSLSRVTGCNLDPGKHWYVVTQSLCGVRLNAFANYDIFRRFPDEIRSVPPADLKPTCKGCSFNTRQPNNLYVVSLFGLCAALLRQPKLRTNGFVYSQKIIRCWRGKLNRSWLWTAEQFLQFRREKRPVEWRVEKMPVKNRRAWAREEGTRKV